METFYGHTIIYKQDRLIQITVPKLNKHHKKNKERPRIIIIIAEYNDGTRAKEMYKTTFFIKM